MAKKITVWVGFSEYRPMKEAYEPYVGVTAYAVFPSKKMARRAFQDARKATLIIEPQKVKP
jgi:hypothetical protein